MEASVTMTLVARELGVSTLVNMSQMTKFGDYARRSRLAKRRIFINATPLLANAGATIVPMRRNQLRGGNRLA
jgi:hypothetical protein